MYKLFLCLHYLRSRIIAYFAILGVALCVFMVLVAVSVMNGFLHKIEVAAKGLSGDIIVEPSGSQEGIAKYEELMAAIRRDVPEIAAASPYIYTGGLLQIPGQPGIRLWVQIAGIRLPERNAVTDFARGLYVQRDDPNAGFNPSAAAMLDAVDRETRRAEDIENRALRRFEGKPIPPTVAHLASSLDNAIGYQMRSAANIRNAAENLKRLAQLEDKLAKANEEGQDANHLELQVRDMQGRTIEPPENHVILGLGLEGLCIRTDEGETVRFMAPGSKILLSVVPLGRGFSPAGITPNARRFTVVDDCRTDVSSIDSRFVYVPFETLQKLNDMDMPDRCSQIHLKVAGDDGLVDEGRLRQIAEKVKTTWLAFRDANPDAATNMQVSTWRQRQEEIISSIRAQRDLVTIMFGIISMVAVVLIFVIFYMIVLQKTREIGVLKAVGASSPGVAQIFLAYGAVVGLLGAAVGIVGGCYFVHYINPIHTWVGQNFGFQVWSRKTFMFEKIPNVVQWIDIAWIAGGAIVAGLIGALIPAVRAARMQPVEALRYE